MRKINRGPETGTGADLHYVYSREDRVRDSHFVDGRRPASKSGFQHKIILFDILFLMIIGGIIAPFIINRNLTGRVDNLSFKMELRRDEGDLLVSVHLINRGSSEHLTEPLDMELQIGEGEPVLFSELPPGSGSERIIRYRLKQAADSQKISCLIKWREKSLLLNGKI